MSRYWMSKQDEFCQKWWNTLKYDVRNKLAQKYFNKVEPIFLEEIKDIWFEEKDNVDFQTDAETISDNEKINNL